VRVDTISGSEVEQFTPVSQGSSQSKGIFSPALRMVPGEELFIPV